MINYKRLKDVHFCKEYGSESLPSIKELVSDTPDPAKDIILSYLRTNLILASPGIVKDLFNTNETIGSGDIFSDGKYAWSDFLSSYVEKYNIVLPIEFRNHILKNHKIRARKHIELNLVNKVIIHFSYFNKMYKCEILKTGQIKYISNFNILFETCETSIASQEAEWIIRQILCPLYCYDNNFKRNVYILDGYSWFVEFYRDEKLMHTSSGKSCDSKWRKEAYKSIIEYIERITQLNLGSEFMQFD